MQKPYHQILRATFSQDVSNEAVDLLYEAGKIATYPSRKFLCRQGEWADRMYVLLKGWVSVYSEIDDDLYHIDNVRSGTFGEISLMLGTVRNAHIMTREETIVLEIDRDAFKILNDKSPQIILELAKIILRRILEQDKRNLVKLKARRDQLIKRSEPLGNSSSFNEKLLKTIFEDMPIEAIAQEVFGRQSLYGMPKRDRQYQVDIFMVMPFREELKPVYEHIKRLAAEMNLTIKRGDDFFSRNAIMSEIWSVTNAAKLVIGDCTGKNPNVFYELGMAHTLGKPTIMITQDATDIPFDLRSFRYIGYENTAAGMLALTAQLRKAIRKIFDGLQT